MNGKRLTTWFLLMIVAGASAAKEAAQPPENFAVSKSSTAVEWLPANPSLAYDLRVQLPDGSMVTDRFFPGEVPFWSFAAGSKGAIDGLYTYELVSSPTELLVRSGATSDLKGDTDEVIRQSGYFTVQNGQVIQGKTEESMAKDIVHADDVIINGGSSALCVGFDCIDGEGFGSDTLRLKENNLRIHFDDTSIGSFPANDWRIIANETGDGGANFLGFEDSTAGRRVMTIGANAPSDSLVIENSSGDVGIGTAAPVLDLHVRDGDTPGLRLEQDNSAGFGAQTWDLAGNETSFFVRDTTNGSTLPFRIVPGASSNSLTIDAPGNVGMGTLSAAKQLDVRGTSADQLGQNNTMMRITNSSGTEAPRRMIELINNGSPLLVYKNTADGSIWNMSPVGNRFVISLTGTGAQELEVDGSGNLTIQGSLTELSSREFKDGFTPVNAETLLAKLGQLRIEEWYYRHTPGSRHVGPVAEDFHAVFGLGPDDGIAPRDLAGIALAAAKALKAENDAKGQRIEALEADLKRKDDRMAELESRLIRLETTIAVSVQ